MLGCPMYDVAYTCQTTQRPTDTISALFLTEKTRLVDSLHLSPNTQVGEYETNNLYDVRGDVRHRFDLRRHLGAGNGSDRWNSEGSVRGRSCRAWKSR